jgi:hypothetical protein
MVPKIGLTSATRWEGRRMVAPQLAANQDDAAQQKGGAEPSGRG